MRPNKKLISVLFLLIVSLLFVGTIALGSGGNFTINWWSVDSGGGTGTSNSYTLNGTAGQPDAGRGNSANHTLNGGFWGGGTLLDNEANAIYMPITLNQ